MSHSREGIVVVIGAGPAGLTGAFELRLGKTYKPIVLESGSLVGGIAGGRGWWIAPALVLLMGLVGIGERLAFQFAVETVTRSAVAYQPILTARLIADGPGLAYLRDHCPDERIALPGRHRPHRPSRCYEVFPMVVLEAFREGTPIVARDLGPYPEIVRQSGGGLLFGTPTELAQCLQRLAAEPGLAAALGLNAALAFARHWREDAALGVYFALIRDCAARRGLEHPALWPRTASGRETIAALVVTRAAQAPWPALGETGEGGRHRHK